MYDLESLVDFFLKTGNFHEPETRIIFTDQDLQRIDQMVSPLYWLDTFLVRPRCP